MVSFQPCSPFLLGAKCRPHARCRCCHSCPLTMLTVCSVGATAGSQESDPRRQEARTMAAEGTLSPRQSRAPAAPPCDSPARAPYSCSLEKFPNPSPGTEWPAQGRSASFSELCFSLLSFSKQQWMLEPALPGCLKSHIAKQTVLGPLFEMLPPPRRPGQLHFIHQNPTQLLLLHEAFPDSTLGKGHPSAYNSLSYMFQLSHMA